jgi:GDP-D-mannose dehydratase
VFAHDITVTRESYDLFALSGILFNHESSRLAYSPLVLSRQLDEHRH